MAQPHGALGLVAVLAAGAGCAIAIDLALPDQRVVAREHVVGSRHALVRFARRGRCGRAVLRRGLARLDVNVDARALAGATVLDARDVATEPTEQPGQLRIDADLRVIAQLEGDVLGETG